MVLLVQKMIRHPVSTLLSRYVPACMKVVYDA